MEAIRRQPLVTQAALPAFGVTSTPAAPTPTPSAPRVSPPHVRELMGEIMPMLPGTAQIPLQRMLHTMSFLEEMQQMPEVPVATATRDPAQVVRLLSKVSGNTALSSVGTMIHSMNNIASISKKAGGIQNLVNTLSSLNTSSQDGNALSGLLSVPGEGNNPLEGLFGMLKETMDGMKDEKKGDLLNLADEFSKKLGIG